MSVTIVDNSNNPVQETQVTLIKADGSVASNAMEIEDGFAGMYYSTSTGGGNVIRPTYDFSRLQELVANNNALLSCITAMEVNIDGTGYTIQLDTEEVPNDKEKERIALVEDFFNNPYPKTSFTTIRRKLRYDLESVGNGYLEVIRNAAGLLIYLKRIDPSTMRLVRLGVAIDTPKTVIRGGSEFTVMVSERPRSYVQKINTKLVYFKDYGVETNIDKKTGIWAEGSEAMPFENQGSEVIHFTVIEDMYTPYGLPRWINQIPSVIGSREAEEYNLEYFNNGGIPPVIISVSGGVMAEKSKTDLEAILNGKAKTKFRGAVIETHSVGGDLSSTSKVDVKVEKFGNENSKDSMFENYDIKCEKRIRSSFRLPPLFVGKADDYSYATAYASYAIGEAQVFRPERFEFDEIINKTIMRELDETMVLKSKPLTIDNSEVQLAALEIAGSGNLVGGESLVSTLNRISNLDMEHDDTLPVKIDPVPVGNKQEPAQVIKGDGILQRMASEWVVAKGWDGNIGSTVEATLLAYKVGLLGTIEKAEFNKLVASYVFETMSNDPEGIVDLCECAAHVDG